MLLLFLKNPAFLIKTYVQITKCRLHNKCTDCWLHFVKEREIELRKRKKKRWEKSKIAQFLIQMSVVATLATPVIDTAPLLAINHIQVIGCCCDITALVVDLSSRE